MLPFGWKVKGIKVCPNCGSTDILSNTYTGYITQPVYVCNRCGYQNSIFPEVDIDEKQFGPPQLEEDFETIDGDDVEEKERKKQDNENNR